MHVCACDAADEAVPFLSPACGNSCPLERNPSYVLGTSPRHTTPVGDQGREGRIERERGREKGCIFYKFQTKVLLSHLSRELGFLFLD